MSGGPLEGWPDRDGIRWPAAVALATFLLHALLVLWLPDEPFRKYTTAAAQALAGELPAERLVDFSPLYLAFHTAAGRLLPRPEAVLTLLQIVLVALAAGLLWCVLRRRFDRLLAGVGVLAFAADRHPLVYGRVLEPEVVLLFLLLVVLFAIDRPDRGSALLAGLAGGLSLATRPNLLPVLLLAPLYLSWRSRRREAWLGRAALFVLPILLAGMLLALRARAVSGDPRTPLMNPGTVFFEGNNPVSLGTSAVYAPTVFGYLEQRFALPDSPHQSYRDVARASAGGDLSIREVNAHWAGLAAHHLHQDPWRSAKHLVRKAYFGLHSFRWHDIPSAADYDARIPLPTLPFAPLAALALAGLLLELPAWRRALLFYALFASQLGVMVVFYASARQRLPLLPAVVYFALVALERLGAWWRSRERAKLGAAGSVLVALAVLLLLPREAMRDSAYRRQGIESAQALLDVAAEPPTRESLEERTAYAVGAMAAAPWAIERMRPAFLSRRDGEVTGRVLAAMARLPDLPQRRFDRGILHLERGEGAEAEALLLPLAEVGFAAYRKAMHPSYPSFYLGRLAALRGDRAVAETWLRRVLARNPGDPFALAELHAIAPERSRRGELEALFGRADAHYLLGRAYFAQGRYEEAAGELLELERLLPDFRPGLVYLAAALGESGRLEAGARAYRAALRIAVEPVLLEAEILRLHRRWLAASPRRPDVRLTTAQVLRQLGRFEASRKLLESGPYPPALRPLVERERKNLQRVLGP